MKYGPTLRERVEWFIRERYHRWYACPRGKHWMKMSGCVYCGKRA